MRLFGLFFIRFLGEFQSQFFLSIVEVFSTYFRAKTFISKEEFSRMFFKSDSSTLYTSFFHTYLSFLLLYQS